MSHEYIFTYRHPAGTHTAADIARWLRQEFGNEYTLSEAMCIARCLLKGESWRPEYVRNQKNVGPCHLEVVIVESAAEKSWREARERQLYFDEVLQKALAGDAEAAFEYCRGVRDNLVLQHACYAGGAP